VNDSAGANQTETRTLNIGSNSWISFIPPTPASGTTTSAKPVVINASVAGIGLSSFSLNWNGTNYSFYDSSLVLAYNFDNVPALGESVSKAVDVSPYGNNGTITGAAWSIAGRWGGAMTFDGVNDYVDCGNPASVTMGLNDWTVELWGKFGNKAVQQNFIAKGTGAGRWWLTYYNHKIWANFYNGSGYDYWAESNVTVSDGAWHHVVWTVNRSSYEYIYIDGALAATYPVASGASQYVVNTGSLVIGQNSNYFNGTLDELRVWNRTMSADEIRQHYYSNLQKFAPDRWLFQSGQYGFAPGSRSYNVYAKDASGNALPLSGRNFTANTIQLSSPTPENGSMQYDNNLSINATIGDFAPREVKFNWNGTSTSFYDDGLVLAFNFDNVSAIGENASRVVDLSRWGNNGTCYNMSGANGETPCNFVTGKYGKAISFDAAADMVRVPVLFAADQDPLALEAWVYTTNYSQLGAVYGEYGLGGDTRNFFILHSDGSLQFDQYNPSGGTANSGPNFVDLNAWTHIAAVKNNDQVWFYKNGAQYGQARNHTETYSGATPTFAAVGTRYNLYATGWSSNNLNGTLDELRIWNRSLSADEIRQHYYGNLAKYAPTRWLFSSTQPNLSAGTDSYYLSVLDFNGNSTAGENRTNRFNQILFSPPSTAYGAVVDQQQFNLNATIHNMDRLYEFKVNFAGQNTTFLNDSLVLAYNFDDVSAIGDSAARVTDLSRWGNNGTIFGNTKLLLHMDEADGRFAYDDTVYRTNASIFGNTMLALHMDEASGATAYDESAYRLNGTCFGTGLSGGACPWAAGKYGGGVAFNGSGGMNVSDSINWNFSNRDFAVSFWVKMNNASRTGSLLVQAGDNYWASTGSSFGIVNRYASTGLDFPYATGASSLAVVSFPWTPASNEWYHVVLTRSGSSLNAYSNGILLASRFFNATLYDGTVPLGIGIRAGDVSARLNGTLDEIAIYNRSVSASEALALFNYGKARHIDWVEGKSGAGLSFDGIDDYAYIPPSSALTSVTQGSFSMEAWVKPADVSGTYRYILSRVGYHTGLRRDTTSFKFNVYNTANTEYAASHSTGIVPNTWYHVAGTFDNATGVLNVYVNGAAGTPATLSGVIKDLSSAAYFVGYGGAGGASYAFNGIVDEVAIYNRTLNGTEVAQHYAAGRAKHAEWNPDGKWNSAIKFDGVDDFINVSSVADLGPYNTSKTFGAWVKPNAYVATPMTIFNYGDAYWSTTGQYLLTIHNATTFRGAYTTNIKNTASNPITWTPGEWMHLAMVANHDTNEICFYRNGALIYTATGISWVTGAGYYSQYLVIGMAVAHDVNTNFFNGSIDEVRIWNRSLSADEIRQQYYSNLAKYAPDKWAFSSYWNASETVNDDYTYYLFANTTARSHNYSQTRALSLRKNMISFLSPTPSDGGTSPTNNVTVNATIQNLSLNRMVFNWDGANTTIYDNDSLVLAYNFDDVASIGDTAGKAVDVSRYGNNGTIAGNTLLLLHMDENSGNTTYDESRLGNNGTCYNMNGGSGVTNCSWASGKSGTGIAFDGVDDYVDAGNAASLNFGTGDFSVEFWFKESVVSGWDWLLSKQKIGDVNTVFVIAQHTETNNNLRVNIGPWFTDVITNPQPISQLSWHHLVLKRESGTVSAYIDGVLYGTPGSNSYDMNLFTGNLQIGRYATSYFNGTIDEVGIYNRSLSASEVLAHYSAGKARHADWDPYGKWNSAMRFDGVDDYVNSTRNDAVFAPYNSSRTISAWVKPASSSTNEYTVVSRGDTYWSSGGFYELTMYTGNTLRAGYQWSEGSPYFSLPFSWQANTWYHVAMVANHTTDNLTVYVNGVYRGSNVSGTPWRTDNVWNTPVKVGARASHDVAAQFFNGSIDEVRMWNRTLSADEIRQQYYSSLNKYAPDKWLFTTVQQSQAPGTHNYTIYAENPLTVRNATQARTVLVG
jgi:hypothetical protein